MCTNAYRSAMQPSTSSIPQRDIGIWFYGAVGGESLNVNLLITCANTILSCNFGRYVSNREMKNVSAWNGSQRALLRGCSHFENDESC